MSSHMCGLQTISIPAEVSSGQYCLDCLSWGSAVTCAQSTLVKIPE